MKKLQLLLSTAVLLVATALTAQIPNPGFEDWNTKTLYDNLDGYFTSNLQTYAVSGMANVSKVSGASGQAVRMETMIIDSDTVPGLIANDAGFFRGVPFVSQPDSVRITARFDIQPGDTAQLVFLFKRNGIPFFFPQNFIGYTGQQSAFTTVTYPLNLPLPPDSLYFIAASSNIFGTALPGSWIEIDDITFTNSAEQVANNNMENWTPVDLTEPDGWGTTNLASAVLGAAPSVREIQGNTGSAAQIEVVDLGLFGDTDTFGFMANNFDFFAGGEPGSPYADQPEKFTFNYRYAPQGNDQAIVYVVFSKWDPIDQDRDSINGGIVYLSAAANWTAEEITFDWTGKPMPDTISVIIGAGDFFAETAVPGSLLDIDDLALAFPTGETVLLFEEKPIRLFPNPASQKITIQVGSIVGPNAQLQVFDVLGRQVYQTQLGDRQQDIISLQGWATGTYLYEIRQGEQRYFGKFVKQ